MFEVTLLSRVHTTVGLIKQQLNCQTSESPDVIWVDLYAAEAGWEGKKESVFEQFVLGDVATLTIDLEPVSLNTFKTDSTIQSDKPLNSSRAINSVEQQGTIRLFRNGFLVSTIVRNLPLLTPDAAYIPAIHVETGAAVLVNFGFVSS